MSSTLPVLRAGSIETDYPAARLHMVDSQLKPNNIMRAELLVAALQLPREKCVLPGQENMAYSDQTIRYGQTGAYLLEPMLVYKLVDAANLQAGEKVLIINSGMGYAAALAAACGAEGVVLEINADLAKRAYNFLQQQGDTQFVCKSGALAKGWGRQAPYDAIIIAGVAAELPAIYAKQLTDNGRITVIAPDTAGVLRGQLLQKLHGQLNHKILFDSGAPFLPEMMPVERFTF